MTRSIILAAFGTSAPPAVHAILAVRRRAEAAFPDDEIILAFTSPTIRKIWHARGGDGAFKSAHPDIPEELYTVPDVPAALAAARSGTILLQSLHITDGEEFTNLQKLAQSAGARIAVGAPALGTGDGDEKCLRRAAEALRPLADRAGAANAALVLAAHGNERLNQSVFKKFEHTLRARFDTPHIHIGTVEAPPKAADVIVAAQALPDAPRNILLAPLMLVAGDHALNDMAGNGADSWLRLFQNAGFAVQCRLEGLGANGSWADIYIEHIREAEKETR